MLAYWHFAGIGLGGRETVSGGLTNCGSRLAKLPDELSSTSDTVLGMATGHRSDTVAPALEALRGNGFFRTIQAADMAPSKPHPGMLLQALAVTGATPEDSVFIGDTTFDMEMEQAARLRSIGVGWGYHQATDWRRLGHIALPRPSTS